jgi:hypothetical protein
MDTCFVMQPFDGGKFDKRYKDIFEPAILNANLEPYRVDQDPKVSIPIQDIERGIRDSRICFAEITENNPNVWFELGFALASGKEVVLVCSDERTSKFPFDVQHRTILTYSTSSTSDFEKLKQDITNKIKAYIDKSETLSTVSEITKNTNFEGLAPYEVVTLAAIAENIESPEDSVLASTIKSDMEASGFTKIAAAIAIKELLQKGFVSKTAIENYDDLLTAYQLTEQGWNWVLDNKDKFALEQIPRGQEIPPEGDIPF